MMLFINSSAIILLWIDFVYTQTCGAGCKHCQSDVCYECKDEYYSYWRNQLVICEKCPDSCKTCYLHFKTKAVRCTSCKHEYYYSNYNCINCRDGCVQCTDKDSCSACKDGYYLNGIYCSKCHDSCAQCTAVYRCSACNNGWWGESCLYSCNTCSDCFEEKCSNNCIQQENKLLCKDKNSKCHDKCSWAFSGPRKGDVYTSRAKEERTTVQAESQTDAPVTPALYIVIAVLGVLVLVVVIVVVVCIIRRKRRQYQESSPPETNNEESHQLSDNTEGHSNVSHLENAIDTIANINVAESDTGYVDMNTIDSVATINVAESNTGFVDMNAAAYENVGDKTAMIATDTVNAYEALNQYTNVQDAENQYTSLSGNANVYYSVLD